MKSRRGWGILSMIIALFSGRIAAVVPEQARAAEKNEDKYLMALLSVNDVCVGYGGFLLLDHIDLNIERH